MSDDLLAYHHLFPDSKWLSREDAGSLQRFRKMLDDRSAWINSPSCSNDGIYAKYRITADRDELTALNEIRDDFRTV